MGRQRSSAGDECPRVPGGRTSCETWRPGEPGRVATTPDEAAAAAAELGGTVAVKAQVHTGGRGKAGGISADPRAAKSGKKRGRDKSRGANPLKMGGMGPGMMGAGGMMAPGMAPGVSGDPRGPFDDTGRRRRNR